MISARAHLKTPFLLWPAAKSSRLRRRSKRFSTALLGRLRAFLPSSSLKCFSLGLATKAGFEMCSTSIFLGVVLSLSLCTAPLRAEGVAFSVSSADLPPDEVVDQQSLIARLKYQAIVSYLQRTMGNRFDQVAKQVTPEFAEGYILEYKVRRSPDKRSQIELSGYLNGDSLRGWIRLMDTRSQPGGAMKPLVIISSEIPTLRVLPREFPSRSKDNPSIQAIYRSLSTALQKFNAKPILSENISLSQPPKNLSEIRDLQSTANRVDATAIVWLSLTPCPSCGGSRLNSYFFNPTQPKALIDDSDDLAIDPRDYGNAEKVRKVLKDPIKDFQDQIGELIEQGVLDSKSQRIVVEGLDSYRAFRSLDFNLGKTDFLVQVVLKRSEPGIAEFEVLSSLAPQEISQRLVTTAFPGFQLKPVRIENQSVTVRYSK